MSNHCLTCGRIAVLVRGNCNRCRLDWYEKFRTGLATEAETVAQGKMLPRDPLRRQDQIRKLF